VVPIVYDGAILDEGLHLDVMVDELVICELKAVEELNPLWEAQLITYLKPTNKRLGFLINFTYRSSRKALKKSFSDVPFVSSCLRGDTSFTLCRLRGE
jgi:GxxExxY protein